MLKKTRQKLKKRINNEKGSMLIEYVIGLLMFVVFVAFCLDVLFIGHKHYFIGEEMGNISRTISVQSGAENSTPSGFPGGSKAYKTSSEITDRVTKVARAAGFKDDDWELYIEEIDHNGTTVRSGVLTSQTNFKANYLNKVSITFRGTYRWDVLGAGVPGVNGDRDFNIKRIAMAEYLRDYD